MRRQAADPFRTFLIAALAASAAHCGPSPTASLPQSAPTDDGSAPALSGEPNEFAIDDDVQGAIRRMEVRTAAEPRDVVARRVLAALLVRSGDETGDLDAFRRAEHLAREVLVRVAGDGRGTASLAQALRGQGHLDAARDVCRAALESAPQQGSVREALFDVCMDRGDMTAAGIALDRLVGRGESFGMFLRAARFAWGRGELDRTIENSRRAVEAGRRERVHPRDLARAAHLAAQAFHAQGHLADAETAALDAIGHSARVPEVLVTLSEIQRQLGRTVAAIETAQDAAAIRPSGGTWLAVARAQEAAGLTDAAAESIDAAVVSGESIPSSSSAGLAEALVARATLRLTQRAKADSGAVAADAQRALDLCDAELLRCEHPAVRSARAAALHLLGRPSEAAGEMGVAWLWGQRDPNLLARAARIFWDGHMHEDSRRALHLLLECGTAFDSIETQALLEEMRASGVR